MKISRGEDGEQQIIRQRRAVPGYVVGIVPQHHVGGQPTGVGAGEFFVTTHINIPRMFSIP